MSMSDCPHTFCWGCTILKCQCQITHRLFAGAAPLSNVNVRLPTDLLLGLHHSIMSMSDYPVYLLLGLYHIIWCQCQITHRPSAGAAPLSIVNVRLPTDLLLGLHHSLMSMSDYPQTFCWGCTILWCQCQITHRPSAGAAPFSDVNASRSTHVIIYTYGTLYIMEKDDMIKWWFKDCVVLLHNFDNNVPIHTKRVCYMRHSFVNYTTFYLHPSYFCQY